MTNNLLGSWNLRIKFVSCHFTQLCYKRYLRISEDHRTNSNPSKCKEMLINFMTNHNFIVNPIVIGGNSIERVKAYKLLGVYISNDLKCTRLVENIVKYSNKRLYYLRVLKQCGAPPASLAKVYTTVVRPALEYTTPVWQNIPDFLSCKIESIQKRTMCIIFPLMNYNEALNALNLTTLCERGTHLCQVYIDRLRHENHPLHLLLPKWEEFVHNYNLRSGVSCITRPSCRTTCKRTQEFVTYKYI